MAEFLESYNYGRGIYKTMNIFNTVLAAEMSAEQKLVSIPVSFVAFQICISDYERYFRELREKEW